MRSVLKYVTLVFVVLFIGLQFISTAKTNPSTEHRRMIQAHTQLTPEVAAILARACYDCHSNETKWPWYSQVAPVSWFVADHVNHGRQHLNFSDWRQQNGHGLSEPAALLKSICEEVKSGEMPLSSYRRLQPEAELSSDDITKLCAWTVAERERLASQAPPTTSADPK